MFNNVFSWQERQQMNPPKSTKYRLKGLTCSFLFFCPLVIQPTLMARPGLNSLASEKVKVNFRWVIFKLILVVNGWGISCETALIWVSLNHTYDKSTLVQVTAWCHQATSHCLSQCWPRSLSPCGVTRPQWVNSLHQSSSCLNWT